LAGGHSRRFGSDKARAPVGGVAMILELAAALSPVAFSITVVAAEPGEYDDLELVTIGDVIADKGPAGGILTALRHNEAGDGADWVLVSACDWVGVRPEWVRELLAARRDETHAVAFRWDRFEPLFALYHRSAQAPLASSVESGQLQMQSILSLMSTVSLPTPDGWGDATNINRPSDIA
jgi:molybdopterin-guanine dinucleotide biosynthesis protein A